MPVVNSSTKRSGGRCGRRLRNVAVESARVEVGFRFGRVERKGCDRVGSDEESCFVGRRWPFAVEAEITSCRGKNVAKLSVLPSIVAKVGTLREVEVGPELPEMQAGASGGAGAAFD